VPLSAVPASAPVLSRTARPTVSSNRSAHSPAYSVEYSQYSQYSQYSEYVLTLRGVLKYFTAQVLLLLGQQPQQLPRGRGVEARPQLLSPAAVLGFIQRSVIARLYIATSDMRCATCGSGGPVPPCTHRTRSAVRGAWLRPTLPHLHRDLVGLTHVHVCAGTALSMSTSAPGRGSPHVHVRAGTGLTPSTAAPVAGVLLAHGGSSAI
jgi:hypothetical protein